MALSKAALKKLSKDKITNLALDYQSKFNSTLAGIRNELSELKKYFEKLDFDLSVGRQVNSVLRERVTSLENQCSKRECLELTSIPDNKYNTLESIVFEIFEKLEVKVDLSNAEDCHCISSKMVLKQVIVKVSKCKAASKIISFKRKLKDMDLASIGISNPVYINGSLCRYYKML